MMTSAAPACSHSSADRPDLGDPKFALAIGFAAFLVNLGLLLYQRRGLEFSTALVSLSFLVVSAHYLGNAALCLVVPGALWRALARIAYLWAAGLAIIVLQDSRLALFGLLLALCAGSIAVLWHRRGRLSVQDGPVLVTALVVLGFGLVALAGLQYYEEQTHFLMPEFLEIGILHKDPMSFIAFVASIMNGSEPGGVIDGLEPFPYHFGTMYFVAALATAADSSPVMGQLAAHHLIFIPLIFFHVTQAVAAIRPAAARPDFAAPIAVALMFLLPGAKWPVVFYSESSAAAIPTLFLFLTFAHSWLASGTSQRSRGASLLLLLPFLTFCLFVKIPTGFMLFAFASYLAAILWTGRRAWLATTLYLLGCAALIIFALAQFSKSSSLADLADLPNLPTLWLEAGITSFIILALLLIRRVQGIEPREGGRVLADPVGRQFLLWFAGAIAGAAVIAAVNFPYNARYLFNMLSIAAIPALSLALAGLFGRLTSLTPRRSAAVWVAPILLGLGFAALTELTRLQPTATVGRVGDANKSICAALNQVCPDDQGFLPNSRPSDIRALIRASSGRLLITQAGRLTDRGAEAFFVPHDAEPVWRFLLSGNRPSDNLQFLPAHFGRPMVLGLPPDRYDLDIAVINASLPGTYDETDRSRPLSDEALCRHAAKLRIRVVAVMADLAPTQGNRVLDCTARQSAS